jgi:hypothetical protein
MPTKGSFRSIVPAGIGRAGHKPTIRHRMGWDPSQDHDFSQSRRSASGKGRRTSSPARSCLVPSLDRGDASARVGSRSGRRDPQYDSEARAQPRCRWPLETAQPHLWSRPELCQKAPILDLYKRIREGRCWAPMIPSFSTNQKTSIPPAAGNRRRSRRRPSARRALSRSTFAELLGLPSASHVHRAQVFGRCSVQSGMARYRLAHKIMSHMSFGSRTMIRLIEAKKAVLQCRMESLLRLRPTRACSGKMKP